MSFIDKVYIIHVCMYGLIGVLLMYKPVLILGDVFVDGYLTRTDVDLVGFRVCGAAYFAFAAMHLMALEADYKAKQIFLRGGVVLHGLEAYLPSHALGQKKWQPNTLLAISGVAFLMMLTCLACQILDPQYDERRSFFSLYGGTDAISSDSDDDEPEPQTPEPFYTPKTMAAVAKEIKAAMNQAAADAESARRRRRSQRERSGAD